MHDYMDDLYELCETISTEIGEANEKIKTAGGKLSGSDVEYIDKLTHSLKSIKAVIAMMEDEGGYSNEDGSYRGGYSREGYSGEGRGSYRGGYSRNSYARGRGRNARRDSMGRYSPERGYSRDGEALIGQLEDMMDSAPDERSRMEIKKLIEKMRQG